MRVRIELRRNQGQWVARFRKQTGFTGVLLVGHKSVQDRQIAFLTVRVDYAQGFPDVRPPGPELYEFKLTDVLADQIRFSGWEIIDRTWFGQQWDCFFDA